MIFKHFSSLLLIVKSYYKLNSRESQINLKLSLLIEGISASAEKQNVSMEEITSVAAQLGQDAYKLKETIGKEIGLKAAPKTLKEISQKKYKN